MAKIRGSSLYAEMGDELFKKGQDYPRSKEIQEFCKNVLDKTFDTWVIVGRDTDERSFKEIEGGNLMSGIVLCNLGKKNDSETAKVSMIKDIDAKGRLAMLLIDAVEGVCEDEKEAESFLEALTETTKRLHAKDNDKKTAKEVGKELEKLDILKGLLHTAVDSLQTYEGKEKYLKSCIGSAVLARILEGDDERMKNKARSSMKAAILGEESDDFARKSVDRITEFVDIVLEAIDAGNSPAEIMAMLSAFRKTL